MRGPSFTKWLQVSTTFEPSQPSTVACQSTIHSSFSTLLFASLITEQISRIICRAATVFSRSACPRGVYFSSSCGGKGEGAWSPVPETGGLGVAHAEEERVFCDALDGLEDVGADGVVSPTTQQHGCLQGEGRGGEGREGEGRGGEGRGGEGRGGGGGLLNPAYKHVRAACAPQRSP